MIEWDTILAIDHDERACKTYRANVDADRVECGNVADLLPLIVEARPDVILGGPPCQPYSSAGKQQGDKDTRDCVPDFCEAVRLLMHEGLHAEFKAVCTGSPCPVAPSVAAVEPAHVERALAYLVMSWQGRNGSAGTSPTNLTVARRFTSNGGSGGLRWASAVESIPVWHERLRTVAILNMDAFELVERIEDADGTAMYLDPPYVEKSDSYSHDLADADHDRLAEVLRQKKRMRCVVSYYDCDRVRDLYRGWTFVLCPLNKATSHQGQRGKVQTTAPEMLIINGPSLTDGGLFAGEDSSTACGAEA